MINEMIESSRMQIRGVVLVRELCSVRRLVEEAGASIHPSAVNRELSVNLQAPDSLSYQWGDREKLAQVLGVFLSNAVKFTPEGGTITLSASVHGNDVTLAVSDSGIGIPREHQERIFRKFYQVDSSMTRHYQGTGIGLSIAKAIVEAHGGRIELESEPGKGSTFRAVLPSAAFRPAEVPRVLSGKHITVVNEFVDSLDAMAEALTAAGAEVTPLVSSFECIRRVREQRPDAIIIDEAVRDLVVVETVRRLREDGSTASIPIITLWDRRGGAPSAEEEAVAGRAHVLVKPFAPEALVRTVGDVLADAQPGAVESVAGKVG
jgi:CheY-like chemotaxis protein